jgi:exodeoxyribonuclease VII large subunit
MPDEVLGHKVFSLVEVCRSIEKTISARYGSAFWVKAEINKLNHYPHSGHAYPELVEKKESKVLAEIRSVIWASRFDEINDRFMAMLGEPLKDGIEVLLEAKVDYSPKYGLSLHILDIDPSFTLGELQKEKQESIRKLKEEKLFDANRSLTLALLPKRIAVISVETSKGYSDFLKVIDQNNFGYRFFHMLFPALLQGEKAGPSIIAQLERIKKVKKHFDVVAIIRGGGGDVGLSTFNDYQLSKAVASFPLPVLSGIGHSTNETVTEMVSYRSAITPTELADFLLQQFHNVAVPLEDARKFLLSEEQYLFSEMTRNLEYRIKTRLSEERSFLRQRMSDFRYFVTSHLASDKAKLSESPSLIDRYSMTTIRNLMTDLAEEALALTKNTESKFVADRDQLAQIEKLIRLSDPINTLKLGYSITRDENGNLINSIKEILEGQEIENIFADGSLIARVQKKRDGKA